VGGEAEEGENFSYYTRRAIMGHTVINVSSGRRKMENNRGEKARAEIPNRLLSNNHSQFAQPEAEEIYFKTWINTSRVGITVVYSGCIYKATRSILTFRFVSNFVVWQWILTSWPNY
jgi:hypothetical protein